MNFQKIISQFAALITILSGFFRLSPTPSIQPTQTNLNPLTIQAMKEKDYPGSDVKIEKTLPSGSNYYRYIASFMSVVLK